MVFDGELRLLDGTFSAAPHMNIYSSYSIQMHVFIERKNKNRYVMQHFPVLPSSMTALSGRLSERVEFG